MGLDLVFRSFSVFRHSHGPDGGSIRPQPAAVAMRVILEPAKLVAAVVGGVPPCQPAPHHLRVDQFASDADVGDHAPVAVAVNFLDRDGLLADQIGEGLL